MGTTTALAFLVTGVFLFFIGYIQRNGGKSAQEWAHRVLVLLLFVGLAVPLDAISMTAGGIGVAIGAVVLAFIFKPWRSD